MEEVPDKATVMAVGPVDVADVVEGSAVAVVVVESSSTIVVGSSSVVVGSVCRSS